MANKLLQFDSFTSSVFPSEANGETEKKKLFLSCGRFRSLLVAFRNSKTGRHSEIKQTRPSTKQDFSGEALPKQNTEASLVSLSCNSSRAPTEWSAIFAFGLYFFFFCNVIWFWEKPFPKIFQTQSRPGNLSSRARL